MIIKFNSSRVSESSPLGAVFAIGALIRSVKVGSEYVSRVEMFNIKHASKVRGS